jgi:hypothetical protein
MNRAEMAKSSTAKAVSIPGKYPGPKWRQKLDGRLSVRKEVDRRFNELTTDLGGAEMLSYQQRSLVERAIWLEFFLSSQECALASGSAINANAWVQAMNALVGLYRALGIARRAKTIPSLSDYIAGKSSQNQTGGPAVIG